MRLSDGTPVTGMPTGSEVKGYQSALKEMELQGSEPVRLLAARARDEHPSFAPSLRGRAVEHADSVLPTAESILWLRRVPLLSRVEPRSLAILAAHSEDRRYPHDAAVTGTRAGEHALTIVIAGRLEGPDRTILGPGAVLNEAALFSEDPAPLVVARSEVRVLELRASVVLHLIRDHFDIFLPIAKKLWRVESHEDPTDDRVMLHRVSERG